MKISAQYYLWFGLFLFVSVILLSQLQSQKTALHEVQKLGGDEALFLEKINQTPEKSVNGNSAVFEVEGKSAFTDNLPLNPNFTNQDLNPPSMTSAIESSRRSIEKVMGNQPFGDVFFKYMEKRFRRAGEAGHESEVQLPEPSADDFELIKKHLESKNASIENIESMEFFRAAMTSQVDNSEKIKLIGVALSTIPLDKPYAIHLITEVTSISNSSGISSTELGAIFSELKLDVQLNKPKESFTDPQEK